MGNGELGICFGGEGMGEGVDVELCSKQIIIFNLSPGLPYYQFFTIKYTSTTDHYPVYSGLKMFNLKSFAKVT